MHRHLEDPRDGARVPRAARVTGTRRSSARGATVRFRGEIGRQPGGTGDRHAPIIRQGSDGAISRLV
jgi:hypothetical protein